LSESLYYEEYGIPGKPVLLFLHGLLGSSRNWRSVAKSLSNEYHIYALDLPEHGNSPHGEETDLQEMNRRLNDWIRQNVEESYIVCGHSLGGKVAMAHACNESSRLLGLVVVDIAPRDYPPEHHLPTLNALLELDLSKIQSRKDGDIALTEKIPNWAFRQFLLTNLQENSGRWEWRSNLGVLRSCIASLSCNPLSEQDVYHGPALFLRGGKSGYLRSEHFSLVEKFFPSSTVVTLPEAGHDLHVEDKEGFLVHLNQFLTSIHSA
jgi:esterase